MSVYHAQNVETTDGRQPATRGQPAARRVSLVRPDRHVAQDGDCGRAEISLLPAVCVVVRSPWRCRCRHSGSNLCLPLARDVTDRAEGFRQANRPRSVLLHPCGPAQDRAVGQSYAAALSASALTRDAADALSAERDGLVEEHFDRMAIQPSISSPNASINVRVFSLFSSRFLLVFLLNVSAHFRSGRPPSLALNSTCS